MCIEWTNQYIKTNTTEAAYCGGIDMGEAYAGYGPLYCRDSFPYFNPWWTLPTEMCSTTQVAPNWPCAEGITFDLATGDCLEFVLEMPDQSTLACNESNPCNPANGNKSQMELDYQSSAQSGLSFARHYNSKGPYKTGYKMAPGWRHTYSRSVDEEPDRRATVSFASPAAQSSFYSSASDACSSGWDDIKSTAWAGDHSTASASFAGGNVCKIQSGGSTIAYLPVRSGPGWSGFTPPSGVKTVTRPNGASHKFELDGSDWVNDEPGTQA